MDQRDEIRKVWGDKLVPIPAELISPQASEPTRQMLSTVGLPTETPPLGVFYHDDRLRTPIEVAGQSYLPIGDDHGVPFAIQLATDQLYQVYPTAPAYNRFANSSIADFLYCYGVVYARMSQLQAAARAGESTEEMADELELAVAARDAPALAEDRYYWSMVLDMARDGEL